MHCAICRLSHHIVGTILCAGGDIEEDRGGRLVDVGGYGEYLSDISKTYLAIDVVIEVMSNSACLELKVPTLGLTIVLCLGMITSSSS